VLCSRSLKAEWLHVNVLVDGERCPFSLRQGKPNGAGWNFRTSLNRKNEVLSWTSANIDVPSGKNKTLSSVKIDFASQ
jgi:hypothetical protein